VTPDVAAELGAVVADAYGFDPPVTCQALPLGFNDHCRVSTGAGQFHLRLHLEGKYFISSDDDIVCELTVVDALGGAGIPVARPLRNRGGDLLTRAVVGGRPRSFAVFELAPGRPVDVPSRDACAALGAAIASIHVYSNVLGEVGPRQRLDRTRLVDEPVQLLGTIGAPADLVAAIARRADEVGTILDQLDGGAPAFGLIHGDLHLGNVHVADGDRITIFDFDHCGFGARAYDLAPLRMSLDTTHWDAVLDGYRSVTPLPVGLEHLDELVHARILWDVGDMIAMREAWGADDVTHEVRRTLPELAARLGQH
jgi:Ser/Thr protein kinase RdoA (MazF antagonist)